MAIEKIQAVHKVSEALSKPPVAAAEDLERTAPNKDHFQNLMNSASNTGQTSFQRIDNPVNSETVHKIEQNPIFADDNLKVQANGSATDQESKKRRSSGNPNEIEEIASKTSSSGSTRSSSLMQEVQKIHAQSGELAQVSSQDLHQQTQSLIAQIDSVKTQLSQGQEIKPAYQTVLRNRLTHIDDNLKIALSKAGAEYTPPPVASPSHKGAVNPMERFLGWLTNSQQQLLNLDQTVTQLSNTPLTPGAMIALQMKMGYIQQQIELFTSVLNKALESTKTIMNVQV